jgi:predicted TIM-barrel fold metal-dependent hydrolase
MTGDEMVTAMAEAGVDKAVVVSPWTLYRTDASYVVDVQRALPDRFRMVTPIDPFEPGGARAVEAWAAHPGAVGVRLMAGVTDQFQAEHPAVTTVVRAATAADLTVCVYCPQQLSIMEGLARLHPETQFVLDHLGLRQSLVPPPPDDPFGDLPNVLTLARYPNVAIKATAACTLSRESFPFSDLWEPLARVFDAFGIDRCMWGTDWTRAMAFASYPQAVAAFRDHLPLSPGERALLMGGVAERIFKWTSARQAA